jgi:hypothetical protein
MTAVGFAWFFVALTFSGSAVIYAIGVCGNTLPYAILIHLLLCFPGGKLEGRLSKSVVALTYFDTSSCRRPLPLHRAGQGWLPRLPRKPGADRRA